MANVNNPHGLRPLMRNMDGGPLETETYIKAAAYGFAIFKWDPVTLLAGVLNGPASGLTAGTTRLLGVSLGFSLASLLANMLVIISPQALFEVQGDGSGSGANVISAATIGFNANLNYASVAGGGVTRDNSGVQLTESTIATTSSLDVNLLRLLNVPGNAYGVNAIVEVRINKHLLNKEVTQS